MPILSTIKEETVCPATTLIVNSATPIWGTVMLCTATKQPPNNPPAASHKVRRFSLIALKIRNKPTRSFLKRARRMKRINHPVAKDIKAAAKPLFKSTESWPFIRDWAATTTPIRTAKIANTRPRIYLIYARNFTAINRFSISKICIIDLGWLW